MSKLIPYLLLTLFSLVLFVPGIASLPVIDRDEAHFSQATRQMLQSGEFFQIRFQEKTRFQKPPGINWLQAASVKLFSDENVAKIWAYRIPSVLSALLSVLLTFYFACRFVGARPALFASAFLASSLLMVIETHMAVIDTSLLSSVILMQGALWIIYSAEMSQRRAHWGWALVFWLAMTYGFVLKGVTPLVGVLSISALCLIERQVGWLRGLRILPGMLLFLTLSIMWLMLVNTAEKSNYLMQMLHKDLLPKLKGGHESHGKPPLFHLAILPLTLWPASLFLWQGGVYAFKKRHLQTVRFLLAWILPTWIFFEMMPTKLPQYVLPTFPAISLLLALAIEPINANNSPGKWLNFMQILWGLLTIGLGTALMSLPYLLNKQLTLAAIVLYLLLVLCGIGCVYLAWKGAYKRAAVVSLLITVLSYPLMFSCLLPQLKSLWLSKNVAQIVDKAKLSEYNPLLVVGYAEPSLVFYLNTKNVRFTDAQTALTVLALGKDSMLLIDEQTFAVLPEKDDLNILATTEGFNYSKGKRIKLILLKYK